MSPIPRSPGGRPPAQSPSSPCPDRRRLLAGTAAAVLGAPALAGCAAPVAPMRIGTIAFPGYELLYLARELRWIDERDVRLVEMGSSTDTLLALGIGRLEGAALTLDELLTVRADGIDLVVVAVLDESAGADALLARPPLRTLRELKGRRVGVEAGAVGGLMLAAALEAAGLQPADIVKVPVTLTLAAEMFDEKQLDAVVTADPFAAQLETRGAVRLFDSTAIPGRIVDVLCIRRDVLDQRPQAVRQLVAAHFRALQHLQTQPDDASRHIALRLRMPPAEVPRAYRRLRLPDAAGNREWLTGGRLDQAGQALQAVMLEQALLRRATPAGAMVDASFLPA